MKKLLFLFLILLPLLLGCGPEEAPPAAPAQTAEDSEPPAEPAPPAQEPETVAVESLSQGLVVFTAGDVFLNRDGTEEYLEIGSTLEQGDVIQTAPGSYCEIQLGEIAVVRMEANTILEMSSLLETQGGNRMAVSLEDGQVVCKVKKLLGDESFKVQVGTVVCGVRGTEFGVSAKGEADVLLAVKEGSVAVVPQSLDRVSELAVRQESLQGVAAKIEEVSLVVGASEEMAIETADFAELEEIAPVVEEVVRIIEEKTLSQDTLDEATLETMKEEVAQQAAVLLTAIEEKPEVVAPAALQTTELSEESRDVLEATEALELIAFTPAEDLGEESAEPALPELYKISLTVDPAEAVILSDGRILSTGAFSRLYPAGRSLRFEFRLEGYESQTLDLIIDEETLREYRIILEPEEDLNTLLPVEEPAEAPAGPVDLRITVEPSDASILIDGEAVGRGSWSGQADQGRTLNVQVQRNGYASRTLTLTAAAGGINEVIRLEPRPIEVSASLSAGNFVGVISGSGEIMAGADAEGKVTAFDPAGRVLWQYQSANTPNANSSPVVHADRIYFSGAAELVVLSRVDGSVLGQFALEEERSHIFGRQVIPFGEDILYPANRELVLMDRDGNDKSSFTIPESSSMSPALWEGRIVIADKKGTLLVLDPSDGSALSSITTGSLQSVAQSPAVYGDRAVFASRKGVVSAVNLADGAVLWERNLDRTVFATVIAQEEGCYIYTTKRELFALSWDAGEDLFPPMQDITAAPGYDQGRLYMTDKAGIMRIVKADNGRVEKSLNLEDSFTARPIIRSGILFGVGSNGKFYRINTAGIP